MPAAWPTPGRDLEPDRGRFPARLIIDPSAITANIEALAALSDAVPLAIVKANAYGHGIDLAARAALDAGCRWFGVAQAEEALRLAALLKQWGEDGHILTWIVRPGEWAPLVEAGVDITVSEVGQVLDVAAAAAGLERTARIHLKIDTGMSRGGASAADFSRLVAAARQAQDVGHCEVVGLWSHLSRADDPSEGGLAQTRLAEQEFVAARDQMVAAGLTPRVCHLAATAGGLWHESTRFDLVRWGISQYGYAPNPEMPLPVRLRPAMRLEAQLTLVKRVAAGRPVSYGGTVTLDEDRWLGIVPVGYANGIPRLASNRAWVGINGQRCRQLGRICMDQMVVDLGPADAEPVGHVGDLCDVLGGSGPDADEWAEWAQTISYEILTDIGLGVPRRVAAPGIGDVAE